MRYWVPMMWRSIAKTAAAARTSGSRRCLSTAIPGPCIVHKRGADILHDPWFNKVVYSVYAFDRFSDFCRVLNDSFDLTHNATHG